MVLVHLLELFGETGFTGSWPLAQQNRDRSHVRQPNEPIPERSGAFTTGQRISDLPCKPSVDRLPRSERRLRSSVRKVLVLYRLCEVSQRTQNVIGRRGEGVAAVHVQVSVDQRRQPGRVFISHRISLSP